MGGIPRRVGLLPALLAAAGCSYSLGVRVPAAPEVEERAEAKAGRAAPRLELTLPAENLGLELRARLETVQPVRVEARETRRLLTHAIAFSPAAELAEQVAGWAASPLLVCLLGYHLGWWVYGRGLEEEERAERGEPWGSGARDAIGEAIWPGQNARAPWSWRAQLLELDDPEVGPWRRRTRERAEPLAGRRIELRVNGAEKGAFGETDETGGTAIRLEASRVGQWEEWTLGGVPIPPSRGTGDPLVVEAEAAMGGSRLVARLEVPASYLDAALRAARGRDALRRSGHVAAVHRELAAASEAGGALAGARAEWRRVHAHGSPEERAEAAAALTALWQREVREARSRGDEARALLLDAFGEVDVGSLRGGPVAAPEATGATEALASRIREGSLRARLSAALVVAADPARFRESGPVLDALLEAAADDRAPVPCYAALRVLAFLPDPRVPLLLAGGLRSRVPEIREALAVAILRTEAALAEAGAGPPDLGPLADAADDPGVARALGDWTGENVPPGARSWREWLRASGRLAWRSDLGLFRPTSGQ
ncbi:MAG: hypothetical protein L0216_00565 [Planctomycetales bacterium]|nr:hypothetical protein [Planctomycetales bacterium]